jgi:signal transduction histidine kinase/HD-like signal output (HDOD) protein
VRQIPDTIRDAVESINLPSIPHVLLSFLHMVEDDQASIKELATLVGQDPSLCARFLTVANSPALRCEAEIKSLERCMIVLGTRLARTLATCLAIQRVFAGISENPNYDFAGFWGHSLRVAELARGIAVRLNCSDVEEVYLAGLLHDVGQLLLLGGVGERYGDMLRLSINETVLSGIEGPMLGTDHAMVAAWLVDQWKLTSFMSDAVLFHHKSAQEIVAADTLSQIIWSSHIVASYNEKIDLEQEKDLPDLVAVKAMLGLELAELVSIRRVTNERVAMLAEALAVSEADDARTLPAPYVPVENLRAKVNDADPAYSRMDALVRDMALMHSLKPNLSEKESEAEILIAVRESAQILFGLGSLAFFLIQPDKQILLCPDFAGQPPLLQRLEIRIDPANSLAAAVASGDKPCSTFDKEPPAVCTLVDVQVARALACEGVLYVPMLTRKKCLGIMVYGLSQARYVRVRKNLEWMTSYAHLAALSIESWRELRSREQKRELSLTNSFEQQARKVVHEARNPLGIIRNYLKIVSQRLPEESDVRQELDILKEEIDRVSQILRRLNDFSEHAPATDPVDINGVIRGMLALYGESLFSSRGITVDLALDQSLSSVPGDRDSLKQILLNLWKNGSEATPAGGRFVISTHNNVLQAGRPQVEIRVSDTGPGLPEDVMERLFQPLEPNRKPGHLGLGLSIVATLVERLGGLVTCQSNPGLGTSFIIQLPQARVV